MRGGLAQGMMVSSATLLSPTRANFAFLAIVLSLMIVTRPPSVCYGNPLTLTSGSIIANDDNGTARATTTTTPSLSIPTATTTTYVTGHHTTTTTANTLQVPALEKVLSHWETVSAVSPVRRRRTMGPDVLHVSLATHGSDIDLVLRPDHALFAHDFRVTVFGGGGDNGPITQNTLQLPRDGHMIGHVRGRRSSTLARLHLDEDSGLMQGIVTLGEPGQAATETLHLEYATRHLGEEHGAGRMLAYYASAFRGANSNNNNNNSSSHSFCGHSHGSLHKPPLQALHQQQHQQQFDDDGMQQELLHVLQAQRAHAAQRNRRALVSATDNTCLLHVAVDFRKFEHEGSNAAAASNKALEYIQQADTILRRSTFGSFTNVGVSVKELHVYTTSASDPYYSADVNREARTILDSFGNIGDFSNVCLAHLFTHVDVPNGVLGLGYVGTASATAGGICSAPNNGIDVNTGFTSSLNHGAAQLDLMVGLVTTHEFGHNLGAEHDETPSCLGGGSQGSYIMHESAVSGADGNNDDFSSCSRAAIGTVLASTKIDCFAPQPAGLCGNGVLEVRGPDGEANTADDEECDAGFQGSACCGTDCKLKAGKVCEDSNFECCTNCALDTNKVCFREFDFDENCHATTTCADGTAENLAAFACGTLKQKPVGSKCINGGTCAPHLSKEERCRPFCEQFSATDCTCASASQGGEYECSLCCEHNPLGSRLWCPTNTYKWLTLEKSDGSVNTTTCFEVADGATTYDDTTPQEAGFRPFGGRAGCIPAYTVLVNSSFDFVVDASTATPTSRTNLARTGGGVCEDGTCDGVGSCSTEPTDFINKIFNFFSNLTLDQVERILRENLVAATLILSIILWVPVSCIIMWHDRKKRRKGKEEAEIKRRKRRSSTFRLAHGAGAAGDQHRAQRAQERRLSRRVSLGRGRSGGGGSRGGGKGGALPAGYAKNQASKRAQARPLPNAPGVSAPANGL